MLSVSQKAYVESADFYFERAYDKVKEGNFYGAISDQNKAIEINPKYAIAYDNRGIAKSKLEAYDG